MFGVNVFKGFSLLIQWFSRANSSSSLLSSSGSSQLLESQQWLFDKMRCTYVDPFGFEHQDKKTIESLVVLLLPCVDHTVIIVNRSIFKSAS